MGITRLSNESDLKKYFEDFSQGGLIDFSTSGYKKWHWQYANNPFCLANDPAVWSYALNDGKAVGHIGVIPVELKVGSKKILAGWAVNFMTLSDYRKKGIGSSLIKEANKHFDIFLAIGTSKMSFPLFIGSGWKFLGKIPYFVKIWDAKTLINKSIKSIFIANVINVPANFFLKIFNFLKKPRKPEGLEVNRIDNFTEEADLFWNEISGYYKIIVSRDKTYLSWKYDRQPDTNYIKLNVKRNGKLCGYALFRCIKTESPKPEGLISDVVTRPDDKDAMQALIFEALEYLKGQGCSFVRCYATSKGIQKALAVYGFIRLRSSMHFVMNKNIDALEEVGTLDNWYITAGDSDIDQFQWK